MIDLKEHIYLVYMVCKNEFKKELMMSSEDIIQCGMLGLCKAAHRYNESKLSINWPEFAKAYISYEIKDYLRAENIVCHNTDKNVILNKVLYSEIIKHTKNHKLERVMRNLNDNDKDFVYNFFNSDYHTAYEISRFSSISNRLCKLFKYNNS